MFSIFKLNVNNLNSLIENIKITKKIVIIDDSLSINKFSDKLISVLYQNNVFLKKSVIINSKVNSKYQKPFKNKLKIDSRKIINLILND